MNIKKKIFVIFGPAQKRLTYQPKIIIYFWQRVKQKCSSEHKELFIKYLGILIDRILSWKHHVDYVSRKSVE